MSKQVLPQAPSPTMTSFFLMAAITYKGAENTQLLTVVVQSTWNFSMQSSRRRLRVRPLRAGDARPRVRELGDEDRQLRGRRRTKERTDGRPRAAGGERERTRAGGGGRAGSDVRAPERPAGSSWRRPRPRARAHARSSATIAQERIHALKARRLANQRGRVEHHGNSGAIKDRVAILYSPNHSSFK